MCLVQFAFVGQSFTRLTLNVYDNPDRCSRLNLLARVYIFHSRGKHRPLILVCGQPTTYLVPLNKTMDRDSAVDLNNANFALFDAIPMEERLVSVVA